MSPNYIPIIVQNLKFRTLTTNKLTLTNQNLKYSITYQSHNNDIRTKIYETHNIEHLLTQIQDS